MNILYNKRQEIQKASDGQNKSIEVETDKTEDPKQNNTTAQNNDDKENRDQNQSETPQVAGKYSLPL